MRVGIILSENSLCCESAVDKHMILHQTITTCLEKLQMSKIWLILDQSTYISASARGQSPSLPKEGILTCDSKAAADNRTEAD